MAVVEAKDIDINDYINGIKVIDLSYPKPRHIRVWLEDNTTKTYEWLSLVGDVSYRGTMERYLEDDQSNVQGGMAVVAISLLVVLGIIAYIAFNLFS